MPDFRNWSTLLIVTYFLIWKLAGAFLPDWQICGRLKWPPWEERELSLFHLLKTSLIHIYKYTLMAQTTKNLNTFRKNSQIVKRQCNVDALASEAKRTFPICSHFWPTHHWFPVQWSWVLPLHFKIATCVQPSSSNAMLHQCCVQKVKTSGEPHYMFSNHSYTEN